jgi:hypothetical protein
MPKSRCDITKKLKTNQKKRTNNLYNSQFLTEISETADKSAKT